MTQLVNFFDLITFNRPTNATRVNALGLIENVPANRPRADYDPVTGALRGLLIEEARTNLMRWSEVFDISTWAKVNTTITSDAAIAPDGLLTADKIVPTTSNSAHQLSQNSGVLTVGETYTFSAYAKAAGYDLVSLLGNSSYGNFNTVFDLQSGEVVSSSNVSGTPKITPAGDGWYRVEASFVCPSANSGNVFFAPRQSIASSIFAGDGTSGILVWGAQLEQGSFAGSFATSYIPTTGAAATRAADVAVIDGEAFQRIYAGPQSTLYVEATRLLGAHGKGVFRLASISNQQNIRTHDLHSPNGIRLDVYSDHTTSDLYSLANAIEGEPIKVAATMDPADAAAVANGGAVDTHTTTTPAIAATRLELGKFGSSYLNGHIKDVRLYPRRLSNAELQELTQ